MRLWLALAFGLLAQVATAQTTVHVTFDVLTADNVTLIDVAFQDAQGHVLPLAPLTVPIWQAGCVAGLTTQSCSLDVTATMSGVTIGSTIVAAVRASSNGSAFSAAGLSPLYTWQGQPPPPPPPPPPPSGTVLIDVVDSGHVFNGTASVSFPVGVSSAANRLLLVSVAGYMPPTQTVMSATYGGVALTRVRRDANGVNQAFSEWWMLVNPAIGSATLTVTLSGAGTEVAAGAITLAGVDQSIAIDAQAGSIVTGTHGTQADTLTPATAGALVVDVVAATPALVAGPAQTVIGNSVISDAAVGMSEIPSAAQTATTLTWSWPASGGASAHSVLAIRPVTGAVGVPPAPLHKP